ncbi:hypothetical protein MNEG_10134, partial [Monoraphidium neglectum]
MARQVAVAAALLCFVSTVALSAADDLPKSSRPVPKNVTVGEAEKPSTMLSSSSKGLGA